MSSSSPTTTGSSSALPSPSIHPAPAPRTHASDALHDSLSHDNTAWVWPSKSQNYLTERVRLLPLSPISTAPPSESSSSSSSRGRSVKVKAKTPKPRPQRNAVSYSQVAESSNASLATPSFRSGSLDRPIGLSRTTSNPALFSSRPLSLTELISYGDEEDEGEDEEDDTRLHKDKYAPDKLHPHEVVRRDTDTGRAKDVPSIAITDERGKRDPPHELKPAIPRRRCYSSPTAMNTPRIPLSSFIDIWR